MALGKLQGKVKIHLLSFLFSQGPETVVLVRTVWWQVTETKIEHYRGWPSLCPVPSPQPISVAREVGACRTVAFLTDFHREGSHTGPCAGAGSGWTEEHVF